LATFFVAGFAFVALEPFFVAGIGLLQGPAILAREPGGLDASGAL
jgi:hypothetical protein